MAKKYLDLINKTDLLINGMFSNLDKLNSKEIDQSFVEKLSSDNSLQKQYNNEYDKLKEEFKSKTYQANKHYSDVNRQMKYAKKIIKTNFPKEEWPAFGVMDKK